jgi:hypothetical protein
MCGQRRKDRLLHRKDRDVPLRMAGSFLFTVAGVVAEYTMVEWLLGSITKPLAKYNWRMRKQWISSIEQN